MEPITPEQQTQYELVQALKQKLAWAKADYRAMFPKPPPRKSDYDLKIEHDMDLIDANPPGPRETQHEYYRRIHPRLTKAWFGRTMRDMGYRRKTARVSGKTCKVWVQEL